MNTGRHVCYAGRPSRWALAHILVVCNLQHVLRCHLLTCIAARKVREISAISEVLSLFSVCLVWFNDWHVYHKNYSAIKCMLICMKYLKNVHEMFGTVSNCLDFGGHQGTHFLCSCHHLRSYTVTILIYDSMCLHCTDADVLLLQPVAMSTSVCCCQAGCRVAESCGRQVNIMAAASNDYVNKLIVKIFCLNNIWCS